jgi:ABC-type branched-subunit amino acid transport system substrate-binding protein
MNSRINTPVIILLLIAASVVGAVGGHFYTRGIYEGQPPTNDADPDPRIERLRAQSLANKTVKIGYVALKGASSVAEEQYIKQIIEPHLNDYASNLGYDVRFEFVVENTAKDVLTYLDKVIEFKSKGINLYIGGNGNLGIDVSLSYAFHNDMVVVSATSAQTDFALGDPARVRLFRISPEESYTGSSLADLMWAYGVRTVVVIQRGNSQGDGVWNPFQARWESLGGAITDPKVRYEMATTDFSEYLQRLDDRVVLALQQNGGAADKVGILALCWDEAPNVATQAENYPNLFKVTWFGAYPTANNTRLVDLAGPQVAAMKWISLKPETSTSSSYVNLSARYRALTGHPMDISSAYLYDSAFLLARSVIEAQSTDGIKVGGVFREVCDSTLGVTGWCGLDGDGDRIPPRYEIWGYTRTASNATASIIVGSLDPFTHIVDFHESLR